MCTKICTGCKVDKPCDQYGKHSRAPRGMQPRCRECERERITRDRSEHPDLHRYADWIAGIHKHGLTLNQYLDKVEEQGDGCAICDEPCERYHIDHDHRCCDKLRGCANCFRGLLCRNCNSGLGMLGDDPQRLRRAAQYLESR